MADELAGGDHRLGLATQSIQLALMEILDEVGGDDAATGAGGGPVEGEGGTAGDAAVGGASGGGAAGGGAAGGDAGESHDFSPQQLFPVHLLGARLPRVRTQVLR